jgi:hypothetical protein
MVSQFAALERRTFSTGRERVDPGPWHDDLCNSAAIAVSVHERDALIIGKMVRNIYPNGAMIYRHGFLAIYWMRPLMPASLTP